MSTDTDSDYFRFVAIPLEARGVPCRCGANHNSVVVRETLHVDEGNGAAQVDVVCPDGTGHTSVRYWTVSDAEFEATFGHAFDDPDDDVDDGPSDGGFYG